MRPPQARGEGGPMLQEIFPVGDGRAAVWTSTACLDKTPSAAEVCSVMSCS